MAISWQWVIKIIMSMLGPILSLISPVIKAALSEFLIELYKKALATENPWDDMFIGMLLDILGIPRPSV